MRSRYDQTIHVRNSQRINKISNELKTDCLKKGYLRRLSFKGILMSKDAKGASFPGSARQVFRVHAAVTQETRLWLNLAVELDFLYMALTCLNPWSPDGGIVL